MKKLQTVLQLLLMPLALWMAAYSANLRAEDIDIYVDNAGTAGTPNVLFVIDNSANLASTWNGGGCSAYAGTTEAPTLGTGTAGGVVQCALVDAINSLPAGALNIGIMAGNANNYATDVRAASDVSYHEVCPSGDGGCLLRKLTLMDATNKTNLVKFIKSWSKNATSATTFDFTINTAYSGQMMQEAYAYYNGKTGISGKNYSDNLLQACQRNFIIYIGNTDKGTSNEDVSFNHTHGLKNAAGLNDALWKKIEEKATFNPAICGNITTMNYGGSASDWSTNWADEWARLMYQQDGGTSTQEGAQNIITYGIGIINNTANQCTADYPALLSKMAIHGGGKYFMVSDASEMTTALLAALNEVQAVNSVFSSASLPVSVNAEGSYLNQIFLGMFRPDSSGAPRWLGNLKQYQLIENASGQLIMGDAANKGAISSGGTGFLAPDALSFWTYKDTTTLPDSVGGFFVQDKKGTPVHGFDAADGEVVEKGGVAQQLRKQNLTATFDGAGGTSVNPRKVYTFCPQGGLDCVKDLTDPSNDFSTANTNIAAAAFGSAITVPVTSIARTGTSALVTTAGNHGFSTGSVVTIRNAAQSAFNVTQAITVNSPTTFTITGLADWPTSPSAGTYSVSPPGVTPGVSFAITGLSRTSSATTPSATETVTVTTAGPHTFLVNDMVKITGITPSEYNRDGWQIKSTTLNTLTFDVPIYPSAPVAAPANWRVVHAPYTRAINSISMNNSTKIATVETNVAHGFHAGQTVTISGITGETDYNASWTIIAVPTATTFTIQPPNGTKSAGTGNVVPSTAARSAVSLTRTGTTESTTAVMTIADANWFANGDKVKITNVGSVGNDSAYLGLDTSADVTITCSNASCTTFTYPIKATPLLAATTTGTVMTSGGGATITAGNITRIGADKRTAQVTGIPANIFTNGQLLEIAPTGASLNSETAYTGSWTISCTVADCSTFTFGPVTLFPAASASGSNMQAYSGTTSPNKDLLIKWLRGQDNAGDEKGPANGVTVRPSMHGDVLHSRPLVINYGDSRGIVVFYGSNDGVYRAVNGNQTGSTNGVPAGGELWGLILPEHYQLINRYRSNAPELKFPQSLLPSAQPKDYFVDGPTGVYQKINADGSIAKAYIFLTMRRGGRFIYALDVTQPASPKYLWSISHQTPGFEELGQTWSRPRLTLLQNLKAGDPAVPTPVLVFGAGYDNAQDSEPPLADSQGRGIFVINAETGALVWSAGPSCDSALYPCKQVSTMKYATPSDIAFVDRDLDGFTDKFYWGDLGGNVWRADVSDADKANWKVSRLAQLGCDTGECASGTTPRKFFFPPAVLSVRAAGHPDSYEAISVVSGDREHPLRNTAAAGSSYNVQDKFFMIKDAGTTVGAPSGAPITTDVTASNTDLFNATSTTYDGTKNGFYISLLGNTATGDKGEKGVNAPVAVNGQIFFSTNRPTPRNINTCAANLGEAKAYAVSPFTGTFASNILSGGGLPPSAVSGLILITSTDASGNTTTRKEKFCIGCGISGSQAGGTNTAPCTSALENCNLGTVIPKNLKRTYWYKK